jgi:hypothetical protein
MTGLGRPCGSARQFGCRTSCGAALSLEAEICFIDGAASGAFYFLGLPIRYGIAVNNVEMALPIDISCAAGFVSGAPRRGKLDPTLCPLGAPIRCGE